MSQNENAGKILLVIVGIFVGGLVFLNLISGIFNWLNQPFEGTNWTNGNILVGVIALIFGIIFLGVLDKYGLLPRNK